MDISVSYPAAGRINFQSRHLFHDPDSDLCRQFIERVLHAESVHAVTLSPAGGRREHHIAELHYCPRTYTRGQVVDGLYSFLQHGIENPPDHDVASHGGAAKHGRGRPKLKSHHLRRDPHGTIRIYRHGPVVTNWEVKHELPGRIRLRNDALYRKKEVCQAIERELMSVLGVDSYKTNPLTASVLVKYDPSAIRRDQIIEILDSALAGAEEQAGYDKADLDFPLCTVAVPMAAAAHLMFPPLLPVAGALLAYNSIPSFKAGYHVLFKERRLGVDVLDSIVVAACLATGSIFAGSVLCWCLGFGRILVKKTQDDSKKMLLNVFGKQPRYVWLYRDGVEIETPLDKLEPNDIIVVNTGEVVPVDGIISEGMAMIDQHALTGESTPAEKGVGDRVFASTVMVAGKIYVAVETSGGETTSAKITRILNDSAGYKLSSQNQGEKLADKAVVPTLALGTLALGTMGPGGAVAVLNSDFGTGIRMAAPLGMLTSLALCAHKGILVKDGRAMELMTQIDTVLFDKTGTLTRERPEIARVMASQGHDESRILQYAAAAENKFSHPIAKAILEEFHARKLPMLTADESQYHVGYGITVGVEGHKIRVGSARFMKMEGIELTPEVQQALDNAHNEGNTVVMVGVDNELGGAIELRASQRPEVTEIIAGLRARGIKHIAIISGDHEAPTRKLAEALGMDQYFAGVLPADKASYVERLQNEGKKVCFVGDGINDSIALKKANVSISLRGASSIATDTAHIVFMEESLSKILDLMDISRELDHNIKRSWKLILLPNLLCIAGAFTMGFGIMASVVTNNVAALAALANGMLPLKKIAEAQAEKEMQQELRRSLGGNSAVQAALDHAARQTVTSIAAPHVHLGHSSQSEEVRSEACVLTAV